VVRFSVLIHVYNAEKFICRTIDSILSQAFTSYEVVVVDDGSTDQTAQLLKSYGTRITVLREANQGAEAARNKAAALAQGEYLAMLDHDDLLLPCALATYDRIIRTFDSPPLIFGRMIEFRDGQSIPVEAQASRPVEILIYPDYLSKDVPQRLCNSQFVIRKSIFDEMGGYGHNGVAAFPADDVNFLLKAGTFGPCVIVKKPYTAGYRQHETSRSWNLKGGVRALLGIARFENEGRYPGGYERRWDRYALIGGITSSIAVLHCWRGGERRLALRLLLGTAPMVFVALWKKSLRYSRKPTQPIVLP
jgi:glycosyltransferase involved in cell wall biosynthesis